MTALHKFMPVIRVAGLVVVLCTLAVVVVACGQQDRTIVLEASPATDRAALVALYEATDGPNWEQSDNWLTDAPLADWYGVTTDATGRVTVLDLYLNGLHGEIPSELATLFRLTELDLRDNRLRGRIPPQLGNLPNLKVLDISYNILRGGIPPELGRLDNLEVLRISDNLLIRGEIPPELGNLSNLKELDLGYNELSGEIPPEFGKLRNLRVLKYGGNAIGGCIPHQLEYVFPDYKSTSFCAPDPSPTPVPSFDSSTDRAALVALYQATNGPNWKRNDNWLTDAPLVQWFGVRAGYENGRVYDLSLSDNGLSGELPPELGNLDQLRFLSIVNDELSGKLPPELGNLTNLHSLVLYNNKLSGQLPPALGKLSNLEVLFLRDNEFSGSIPSELGDLHKLDALLLSNNRLAGQIPAELGAIPGVLHVDLTGNQFTGCLPSGPQSLNPAVNLPPCIVATSTHTPIPDTSTPDISTPTPTPLSDTPTPTAAPTFDDSTDRAALEALYEATRGPNWRRNDSWRTNAPLRSWRGVTTDESGRVIGIYLGSNGLRGHIPPELGNLTYLRNLDLSYNQLTGNIPAELGGLANLETLELRNNQLTGNLPAELIKLDNLSVLTVSVNQFEGCIPSGLTSGKASDLYALAIPWCDLVPAPTPTPTPAPTVFAFLRCDTPWLIDRVVAMSQEEDVRIEEFYLRVGQLERTDTMLMCQSHGRVTGGTDRLITYYYVLNRNGEAVIDYEFSWVRTSSTPVPSN